jgi:hypothetical protein
VSVCSVAVFGFASTLTSFSDALLTVLRPTVTLAGAGYSSDSGLPVYKDIANVPAYREMGVTYQVWRR